MSISSTLWHSGEEGSRWLTCQESCCLWFTWELWRLWHVSPLSGWDPSMYLCLSCADSAGRKDCCGLGRRYGVSGRSLCSSRADHTPQHCCFARGPKGFRRLWIFGQGLGNVWWSLQGLEWWCWENPTTYLMLMKFTKWTITSTFSSVALALHLTAHSTAAEPVITASFSMNAAVSFCMPFGSWKC